MAISNTLAPKLSLQTSLYPKTSLNTQTTTASGVKPLASPPMQTNIGAQFPSSSPQGVGATAIKGLVKPPPSTNVSAKVPTPLASNDSSYKYNTQTGALNTNYSGYTAPPPINPPTGQTGAIPPPPQQYSQTNPATFPTLVNATANQATRLNDQASNINTTAGLIGSQGQVTPQEQAAKDKLANLIGIQGSVNANIENHPSEFAFQMGREAVAGRNIEAMRQSLAAQSEAYSSTRQANTQAYTGQANAQNAAGGLMSSAGGILNNAAGQLAPQVTGYGQTAYNPGTNTFGADGGGNLDPQTQATSLAQKVINKQMTYEQAISSIGYAGSAGTNFLNSAITQVGGNPLSLQAQGTTQQGVITSQGTQVAQYQSALQQGQNLQAQLTDLIKTFGLNPNDVNVVNAGLQKIAQNTSSAQYKQLQNYINDVANTYAQILTPPGGAATDTTRGIASSMLDATASGQSILSVMKSLDNAAKAKIAGIPTTGGSSGGGSITTQAADGNTYGFYQDAQGLWHAK